LVPVVVSKVNFLESPETVPFHVEIVWKVIVNMVSERLQFPLPELSD